MDLQVTLRIIGLVALVLFVAVGFVQPAWAQDDTASGDRGIADKKGIGGVFAGKGLDSTKGPTPTQKYLGIGSLVVAFLVWKFL